jgi:hypothetical protein
MWGSVLIVTLPPEQQIGPDLPRQLWTNSSTL